MERREKLRKDLKILTQEQLETRIMQMEDIMTLGQDMRNTAMDLIGKLCDKQDCEKELEEADIARFTFDSYYDDFEKKGEYYNEGGQS